MKWIKFGIDLASYSSSPAARYFCKIPSFKSSAQYPNAGILLYRESGRSEKKDLNSHCPLDNEESIFCQSEASNAAILHPVFCSSGRWPFFFFIPCSPAGLPFAYKSRGGFGLDRITPPHSLQASILSHLISPHFLVLTWSIYHGVCEGLVRRNSIDAVTDRMAWHLPLLHHQTRRWRRR